ncbi:ComEC family competence protein, partial [bacterium]|nr:ComEC family competence protein [bacterium]
MPLKSAAMQPDSIRISPPVRPIVLVALAHLAGVMIGLELSPPILPLIVLIAACVAAAAVNFWRSRRIHGPALAGGNLLLLAMAALGAWQGSDLVAGDRRSLDLIEPWIHEPAVTLTGSVAEPPRIGPDWAEIVVSRVTIASRERQPGSIGTLAVALRLDQTAAAKLAANRQALPIVGQQVRAEGWLVPIAGRSNPSTFDTERYWISRGIGARMRIARLEQIEIGPRPGGWRGRLERPMSRLRDRIGATLDRLLSPEPAKLARALVLGQAEMISEDARDAFRLAGWAHLLAVSGQNAGIVLLLVIGLARLMFMPPKVEAWLGIGGVLFYMALTGFLPPVTRAGIMTVFILAGFALGRPATSPASIAMAAFVTLVYDPRNLTRLDWQLSYVCVLSMILLAPPIYELFTSREPDGEPRSLARLFMNRYIILPVAVSTAIQLGLLPLQIAYFRQVNLLIAISNIFGIFAASLATGFAIVTAAFGWIPYVGAALGSITNALLFSVGAMAGWFAGLPGTIVTVPVLAPLVIALFYGLLLTGKWLQG